MDFDFHELLAKATRNHYAVEMHTRLYRLIVRFAYLAYIRAGTCESSLAEHRLILDAFARRDPIESEQQVLTHLMHGRARVISCK